MTVIYVLIYSVLGILIYNLISLINVWSKQKQLISYRKKYISNNKKKYFTQYMNKIESKLFNLGYPYKLNVKRYLIIKYVLSIGIFIIAYFNYKDIKVPLILSCITFFIPNYLISNYIKSEKFILINEIKNITNSLILSLSSYTPLKDALKIVKSGIEYERFKVAYDMFEREYSMNGYNLKKPARELENKFNSYELSLFLGTLIQGDAEGDLLECLEKFRDTLELNYFKYLKRKAATRLLYVTLGTVISLVDIILVVTYPIFIQVINNLQLIFS